MCFIDHLYSKSVQKLSFMIQNNAFLRARTNFDQAKA